LSLFISFVLHALSLDVSNTAMTIHFCGSSPSSAATSPATMGLRFPRAFAVVKIALGTPICRAHSAAGLISSALSKRLSVVCMVFSM
jgi:hypothetical protein